MKAAAMLTALLLVPMPAQAREIYSMMCEGKAVFYDTMNNLVTITTFGAGGPPTTSHVAEKVEKVNGFVAVDVNAAKARMIFRFREHPVKGKDNDEALFVMPNSGGQSFQACTQ